MLSRDTDEVSGWVFVLQIGEILMSKLNYVTPTLEMVGSFEATTLSTGHGKKLDYTFSQTTHTTTDDLLAALSGSTNELS
jgi:hypothetical protein